MSNDGFSFKLIWIVMLLFCFVNCNITETKNIQSAESLKIYRLLIRQYYADDEEEIIMINQSCIQLRNPFYFEQLWHELPMIDHETVEDFITKNRDANEIAFDFPLDAGYRFLSFSHYGGPKEHDRKFKNWGKRVKKLFPYKIIEFSKVGFNKKVNQAIVQYGIYGSSQSIFVNGTDTSDKDFVVFGRTVLLEKKMGPPPHVWTIRDSHL